MYQPPPWMQFPGANFGSMAPQSPVGGMGAMQQPGAASMPQGGLLNSISSALQGNPTGGLAKQLFGGIGGQQPPQAPGATMQSPPQMGLLTQMLQGLGGGAGAATGGGAAGFSPTALSGLW